MEWRIHHRTDWTCCYCVCVTCFIPFCIEVRGQFHLLGGRNSRRLGNASDHLEWKARLVHWYLYRGDHSLYSEKAFMCSCMLLLPFWIFHMQEVIRSHTWTCTAKRKQHPTCSWRPLFTSLDVTKNSRPNPCRRKGIHAECREKHKRLSKIEIAMSM